MVMRLRKAPKGEKLRNTIKSQEKQIEDLCARLDVLSRRVEASDRLAEENRAAGQKWKAQAEQLEKQVQHLRDGRDGLKFQIQKLECVNARRHGVLVGYRQHIRDMAAPDKILAEAPILEGPPDDTAGLPAGAWPGQGGLSAPQWGR
jgi:chromosome segregation ATPase